MIRAVIIAFFAGFIVREVIADLYARWLAWKYERAYQRAVARMIGCRHTHTKMVDLGLPAEKCIDCWAVRDPVGIGNGKWWPNCAPPP